MKRRTWSARKKVESNVAIVVAMVVIVAACSLRKFMGLCRGLYGGV